MQDAIIKGTGNSRYLKSVANAMTLYPTYESFLEALVAGTFPIDLNGLNPSGWENQGTKVNKASLLTDATAQLLGGVNTPNEALEKLAQITSGHSGVLFGSYSGEAPSGANQSKNITLPIQPKAILIMSSSGVTYYINPGNKWAYQYGGLCAPGFPLKATNGNAAEISGEVLTVCNKQESYSNTLLNLSDQTYYYLAIY